MGEISIHLKRDTPTAHESAGSCGIAWVPASDADVESIMEGIRAEDAGAVKAALIEALKRWYTPRPAAAGEGGG